MFVPMLSTVSYDLLTSTELNTKGEIELDINNESQCEAQEKKDFVLELVYENIKLLDQNIRFMLENYRLKEDLKELKRLKRWWKGF